MDWLKEWVRSLVVLVILAATLEMALPMGEMKRYVKLTMGLVIMFAMLSPIATLLRHPLPIQWQLFEPQGGALPSMSQVMTAAKEFSAKQEVLAKAGAEEQLAAGVRQAVLLLPGVRDAVVAVRLGPDKRPAGATVVVDPGSPTAVRSVEPVMVGGGAAPRAVPPLDPALAAKVEAVVREQLGATCPVEITPLAAKNGG
jgi:stage III sporulation protein AF